MDVERECVICGRPSGREDYCVICSRLRGRRKKAPGHDMQAVNGILRKQWSGDLQAFTCWYTGISLGHEGGAKNAEWEHRIPGVECSVVLVAALVNRMKADLTEDQWDAMIRALHELRIEGKRFDESALPSRWQTKATSWRNGD